MSEGLGWRCTWCGEPSHEPEKDELITCPKCGTNGVCSQADGHADTYPNGCPILSEGPQVGDL